MKEAKHTTESYLTEEGGIIHLFQDGTYTYIEPEILHKLIVDYMHLTFHKLYKEEWKTLLFFI